MNLNTLWEYANPKKFIQTTDRVLPWVAGLAALTLGAGLVWGFFFTPDDYRQGSTVKIIYLHVPSALMAINAWLMMLITSLVWIVRRHHVSALAARAAAPVGLVMTLIALLTGAIWGQPMWGTWWAWDARLTSMLIQFFLLIGVIALRSAIESPDAAAKACALLAIVGAINVPIIKYSVEWWNTLHQPASNFSMEQNSAFGPEIWVPLVIMIFAVYCFFIISLLLSTRNEILQRERRAQWVMDIVAKEQA